MAFLREASEVRPIGLVLEDMHWADAASWDVLEHVLAQLTTERIFIALTVPMARFTDWLIARDKRRQQGGRLA